MPTAARTRAKSFPRIAVFSHEGRLFTNCGVHFCGAVHAEADCYALIPGGEYRGPEQRQYTCEGREAAYRGEVFRLGPKVVFKTSDPTVEEWRRLLRVHYADGGMFAARCTYLEFLAQRFAPNSENEDSLTAFGPHLDHQVRHVVDDVQVRAAAEFQQVVRRR